MGFSGLAVRGRHALFFVGVAALIASAAGYVTSQSSLRASASMERQLAKNVGRIMTLDELLTMSARMAASSRDPAYEARYLANVDELDRLIKDTVGLVPDAQVMDAVHSTDEANQRLVGMEMRSFELDKSGRYDEAARLVASEDYRRDKAVYANGMGRAYERLENLTSLHTAAVERQSMLLQFAAIASLGLLLVAWTLEQRERRRRTSEYAKELEASVTSLEHTVGDLEQARTQALAASRAKSEFLANMSHEIRTPMNGIIGMTELALDTEVSREQRDYLEAVKSSADALMSIINDILDFSKIEARKLRMESVPFDLRECLGDSLTGLAVRAHQKGLELVGDIPASIPQAVLGDPNRVQQVVINLVGNAIKFTNKGEIVVRVGVEEVEPDGSLMLHVSVSDTGIGIHPDMQKSIFDAFTQADSSITRRFGGTGLGLSISAQLVHLMGGRMWVESELGRGSTFHFTIGTRRAEPLPSLRPKSVVSSLKGLATLVVDDHPINRRVLHEMLTNWEMKPTTVDSASAALAALRAAVSSGEPFALVLLDAMMPDVDGFTVARQIKDDPYLAGVTVMMLSSMDTRQDISRCKDLGIAAYVQKPLRQSDLLDAILRHVGGLEADVESERHALSASAPAARPLRILLAEDNPINRQVAAGICMKHGHSVEIGRNGVEALEWFGRAKFDVVLMDVQMPLMDGFEATQRIRALNATRGEHTQIVAMTAHAMAGDRERCLENGMDDYVSKPIRANILLEALSRAISRLDASPARAEPSLEDETLDRARALAMLDGDAELLKEAAQLFVAEAPGLVAALRAAVEAGDPDALERAAHCIKSCVGQLGADATAATALELETMGKKASLVDAPITFAKLARQVARLLELLPAIARGEAA